MKRKVAPQAGRGGVKAEDESDRMITSQNANDAATVQSQGYVPHIKESSAPQTPSRRPHKHDVHHSSKSAEHYTPDHVIELVRRFFPDGIDLDPCADPGKRVPAHTHYCQADNGLSLPWSGHVYMNPPYGRQIGGWIRKAIDEVQSGRAREIVALLPVRTDTKWFAMLRDFPVCLVRGRLTFVGNDASAPFPSCLVWMSNSQSRAAHFVSTTAKFGDTWGRIGEVPR